MVDTWKIWNYKQVKAKKDINPKYNFLTQIRSNRKKVEIHDLETYKVGLNPSIYKAALDLDQNPGVICIMEKDVGTVMQSEYLLNLNLNKTICSYVIRTY